jgi:hypothetical protein
MMLFNYIAYPIVSNETCLKLVNLTESELSGVCRKLLYIPNDQQTAKHKPFSVTIFILKTMHIILEVARYHSKNSLLFQKIFFDCLQLTTCLPIHVSTTGWNESTTDLQEFSNVKDLALKCCNLIVNYFTTYMEPIAVNSVAQTWIQQCMAAFFDISHCGSVSDHRSHVLCIVSVVKDNTFLKTIWKLITQDQQFWIDAFSAFIALPDAQMSVKDNLSCWSFLTSEVLPPRGRLLFDHDGLSNYARMGLLFLGILQEQSFSLCTHCNWIIVELERFRLVLDDSLISPFESTSILKNKDVVLELDHTLDNVVLLDSETPYDLSDGGILSSGLSICNDSFSILNLCNIRLFSKLLLRYMSNNEMTEEVLSSLLFNNDKIKGSLLLQSCIVRSYARFRLISVSIAEQLILDHLEILLEVEKIEFEDILKFEKGYCHIHI